jgi:hypothetical protein
VHTLVAWVLIGLWGLVMFWHTKKRGVASICASRVQNHARNDPLLLGGNIPGIGPTFPQKKGGETHFVTTYGLSDANHDRFADHLAHWSALSGLSVMVSYWPAGAVTGNGCIDAYAGSICHAFFYYYLITHESQPKHP